MKKLILFFAVICVSLASCNSNRGVFEEQASGGTYLCDISYLGETFSAKITLSPMVDGARESLQIEYLEPESLSGYTVKRNGDSYYAVVSDLEIPVTKNSIPQLAYTDVLFALSDEDITSIDVDGDGNSVVKASCGDFGAEAVAVYLSDGKLVSLSLPGVDFSLGIKEE